jgi:ribosomal protein S18 acetylase RimI-like enzyme
MMDQQPVAIRHAKPADAAALAAFAARTFYETYASENEPEHMTAHLESAYGLEQQSRELTDPNYSTVVAESKKELAGYAQLRRGATPSCVTSANPVELYRFYVDRPWHGAGLAQELMSAAHAAARDLGGAHVWLGVWEHNLRARAFYAKEGFVDVGTTHFMVGPDKQTDRVLVARLAG